MLPPREAAVGVRMHPLRDAAVALGLFVLTNGPVLYVARRILQTDGTWEDPFVRPVFVATALVATATVIGDRLGPGRTPTGRRLSPVALAAAGGLSVLAVVSTFWSLDSGLTLGRSVIYLGLVFFAIVLAGMDETRLRQVLLVMLGAAVGLSLLAVLLSDTVGLDRNDDWRGIYTNRNSLAPLCGVAIIVAGGAAIERRGRTRAAMVGLVGLAVIVMLGSGSRTAWLALALAVGATLVTAAASVGRDRFGGRAVVGAASAGVAGLAVVAGAVASLWDESTFAQRRTIWEHVWDRIGERPWHGFGWFNVWSDAEFTSAHELLTRGSAHNSLLEVWVGVGVFGLVAYLVVVGLAVWGAARDVWRRPAVGTGAWLAVMVFLAVENLTESFVLWFSYNWVLLSAGALRSGVGVRPRPATRTPEPIATATG